MSAYHDPNDPLLVNQWHLTTLRLSLLWNEYTGQGIFTGVYDDGLDKRHADLASNYDASREFYWSGTVLDPSAGTSTHGTAVAGLIAAVADNGIGGVGVSYGSKITGVDTFGNAGGAAMLDAVKHMAAFDTTNNSWNWTGKFSDNVNSGFGASFSANLKFAADNGRSGLGTVIVNSASNDWFTDQRDSNYSGFNQSRHTITVGAIDDTGDVAYYSTRGASVLVSGPSSGGWKSLTTTDETGSDGYSGNDYTDSFGGTSGAAPIVTGVVNLMLEASGKTLGWRDVQNILAISADQTGPTRIGGPLSGNAAFGWTINGAGNVDGGGMHFSNDVGYGLVDAFEAVRFAEVWRYFGAAATSANEVKSSMSGTITGALSDNTTKSFAVNVADRIVVEHVDLTLTLTHSNVNELRIELVSPDGTNSILLSPMKGVAVSQSGWTWTFGSDALRGETSYGAWSVRITDTASGGKQGSVAAYRLDMYGSAPTGDDVYHYTNEFAKMAALDASRTILTDADGGIDWINMAGMEDVMTVNLQAGTAMRAGVAMFVIAAGTVIENVVTGDGADTLVGNSSTNRLMGMRGDDILAGGAGSDTLDGGTGIDTARYAASLACIDVDLTRGEQIGGDAQDDVLIGIENVVGSAYDDVIKGDAGTNVLTGGECDDILDGRGGNDLLDGGTGTDFAFFSGTRSQYAITVLGDGSFQVDDLRFGSPDGRDIVRDTEWLRFLDRDYAASEFLPAPPPPPEPPPPLPPTPPAGKVINGTSGADTITSAASKSAFRPTEGADTINAGAGNDYIKSAGGKDVINAGAGKDTVYAGNGDDLIRVSGSEGVSDVIRAGEYGEASGDALELRTSKVTLAGFSAAKSEIEHLKGNGYAIVGTSASEAFDFRSFMSVSRLAYADAGSGNDALFGSRFADYLKGGSGNDRLTGGSGSDILSGGSGNDRFIFTADASGKSRDRIVGFGDKPGDEDIIDLSAVFRVSKSGFTAWKSKHVKQVGSNTVISFGDDQIVLSGVKAAKLDYADFDLIA